MEKRTKEKRRGQVKKKRANKKKKTEGKNVFSHKSDLNRIYIK